MRASLKMAAFLFVACKHLPSEKEIQTAEIHYDLGVQAQRENPQQALKEYERALELNPNFPEAHHALGVLLHLAFGRLDEAVSHYKQALALRPGFSEAKTNLANVYMDQKRYGEAIALYEEALNDMQYPTPYIAQNNLGWALYKKGEVTKGIDHIKAAITTNPKFCQGYRNLGLIYGELSNLEESCRHFARYRESCPEMGDAHFREGVCLARLGQVAAARQSFETCEQKATTEALKDDCRRMRDELGQ